jgi:flagellar hook-associated protein 1 FlgK
MALPNIFNTGRSGMMAARTQIATAGHNIANANTEGYSRQRVEQATSTPSGSIANSGYGSQQVGSGANVKRIERVNDEYLEKAIRNANRDLSSFEEKDISLRQIESIFNEMNGEGLNRLLSKFFNDFRRLSTDPTNLALREAVRESAKAVTSDIRRIYAELNSVRDHLDSRIEGMVREVNSLLTDLKQTNLRIQQLEVKGAIPNDLLDKRDLLLKQLGAYFEVNMHKDNTGAYIIDVPGVGPVSTGPIIQEFSVTRSPKDDFGKPENSLDVLTNAGSESVVTHRIRGGKLGGAIEVRDQLLGRMMDRMDELAFALSDSVNQIHQMGFDRYGNPAQNFFNPLDQRHRAAEKIKISDAIENDANRIATAAIPDAPSDNRIALAIANIQGLKFMSGGTATMDDWYNSIVSDIGVMTASNRSNLNQQKDVVNQLSKFREQISGVSIDEETANLLQFQHVFDASAKVVQVADELLKTVLDIKR